MPLKDSSKPTWPSVLGHGDDLVQSEVFAYRIGKLALVLDYQCFHMVPKLGNIILNSW